MHEKERCFQFIGGEERRDFQVHVCGLPHRAPLILETKGRQSLILSTAGSDTGAEQIAMGHQVDGHHSAVTVPCYSDTVGVGNAKADGLIDWD